MNYDKLKYVVEVASCGSIKLAATNLYVTESAISQSISGVEKELGVKIFTRSRGQDTSLTDEGKKIVQKAYEILMKYEELKEITHLQSKIISGKVIVATSPGLLSKLIKPMYEFKERYPNVNIEIIEKTNAEIIEGVQQQRFDIGLIVSFGEILKDKEDIDYHLITNGRVKAYTKKDSLLGYKGQVLLEDLQQHSIIPFHGDYTSFFIKEYTEQIGPLPILFESNSTEAIQNAVMLGLGFTISYDFLLNRSQYFKNDQIISIDIIDTNQLIPLDVACGWICSKNKHLTSISKIFIKTIESSLSNE